MLHRGGELEAECLNIWERLDHIEPALADEFVAYGEFLLDRYGTPRAEMDNMKEKTKYRTILRVIRGARGP